VSKEPSKLKKNNLKVLEYWYDSLVQGKRTAADLKNDYLKIDNEVLASGRLNPKLFKDYLNKNLRNKKNLSDDSFEVLISPVVFSSSRKEIAPLWIPARVDNEGVISPARNHMPWIPRNYLEPIISDVKHSFVIGEEKDSKNFFERIKKNRFKDWREFWKLSQGYFKFVSGESLASIQIKSFERQDCGALILDESIRGAHVHVEKLCRQLLASKLDFGLLHSLCEQRESKRKVYSRSRYQAKKTSSRHLGQFEDEFSLSHSQRLALHRTIEAKDSSIVCVSGPPGTGKTTLIQGVVASVWTESAFLGDKRPPVIVACGETNQSVTNIISSFSSVSEKDLFSKRWLPELNAYGRYCCSKLKEKSQAKFHIEMSTGEGLSSVTETFDYLKSAKGFFLENYNSHYQQKLSLRKAVKNLRAELVSEVKALRRGIDSLDSGGFLSRIKESSGRGDYETFYSFISQLAAFDTTHRFKAFMLATHYWEARWLQGLENELIERDNENDDSSRFRNHVNDWQLRSMLTPVFVSTFSMAPRFFYPSRESERKSGKHEIPPIDILIVDEAAKSSPETVAPTFALAKKALVVGDRNQLEPVWNITPANDRLLQAKHGLQKTIPEEMSVSSGDLMGLASHVSGGVEQDKKGSTVGVFLSEHRRSVPEIVSFCNDIAYLGRLDPLRLELKSRILPAMGFFHVSGDGSKLGGSRQNKEEAEKIKNWLRDNADRIKDFYKVDCLDKTVAVITPFFAQARFLEKLLLSEYPKMTIGTVGALQGAESKIVIFSSVYDTSFKGQYFFDKNINHLNVAVSRAKDSFLVFGDMRIFKKESQLPSGVLARALFQRKEQDIR